MYHIIPLFTPLRKFVPNIVYPFCSKIEMNAFIQGAYAQGFCMMGAYIQVLKKRWVYRWRNTIGSSNLIMCISAINLLYRLIMSVFFINLYYQIDQVGLSVII